MKKKLSVYLANPRGFCAGVDRAIQIVELALKKYGAPVYVRHEIVHNKYVVNSLKEKGAIFVEEVHEAPQDRPIIFSAHGVAKSVPASAEERNMIYIDATCPLVSKVHREVERAEKNNLHTILIGHKGHPEVIGTMGQVDANSITLVETVKDVDMLSFSDDVPLAYASQTTLSVDETKDIIQALKNRYPHIQGPHKEDICYATTNRQKAVKETAPKVDGFIIIGAPNSSNSKRLVEVAKNAGVKQAFLYQRSDEIDWDWIDSLDTLGITAGASAPEILVQEILTALKNRYEVDCKDVNVGEEDVVFHVPKKLKEVA